ncbi:tripartite motif-containing protein 5-like isoform X2 [Sceloporus undulatus]|uniref:tripartite motif-containing protein 5-like isoform X2 n=1 Tax=Sceloporus undulatus TaxID=8520 RepID=UPI001C4AD293|nr:tripartite motif-containing protein 5-like isoform X2 [Sceloporus undulatus]
MASGKTLELLCQGVTCPVCQDYFNAPVILNCGHNVCRGCLTQQHQSRFGNTACCPQCRKRDEQKSFRPNWQLAKMVELVKELQGGERTKQQANCHKTGTHSKAIQYLKMKKTELVELCQEKGLDREGLSVDELRIILIQEASQPETDTVKLNAKGTQGHEPELEAQRNGEWKERRQFTVLRKRQNDLLTAQAEQRKSELERMYLKEKQADKPIPWVFPPFSSGQNPLLFLAAFERTSKQWNMSFEDSMKYLVGLIRGKLAEVYHAMPKQKPVTLQAFKEAVFKQFIFNPDHFYEKFWALKPQPGVSWLEFGAKLEETLNWWLDTAKADDREKVIHLMVLNQFCSHLPSDIQHSVKAKAPKNVSEAAEIADQLMLSQEDSGRRTPHLGREQGRAFPTSEAAEGPKRTEIGSPSVEHRLSLNVTNSDQFKKRPCHSCGKMGHLKTSCPSSPKHIYRITACHVKGEEWSPTRPYMEPVLLGNQLAIALVSTGSQFSLVRADLVSPYDIVPGESVEITTHGTHSSLPVASLQLNWKDIEELVDFGVAEKLFVPVLIGMDILHENFNSFSFSQGRFTVLSTKKGNKQPKASN